MNLGSDHGSVHGSVHGFVHGLVYGLVHGLVYGTWFIRVAQKCKKSWNQAFVLILHTQHLPKHRNMNIFHFKAFYAERRPLEGNSF